MSGCTVGHVCKGPQMHTHTPCHSKVKRQAGVGCGGAGEPKISLDLEVSDSEKWGHALLGKIHIVVLTDTTP